MCQEVVKEFLGDYPNRWFGVVQISDGTGLSLNSVFLSCKKLRKSSQVLFRMDSRLVGDCMKDIIVYRHKG